jgi:Protein of unknown function (DUF4199)
MLENQILDAPERNELPVLSEVSPYPIIMKYGLIQFLVSVSYQLGMIIFNLTSNQAVGWLSILPGLVIFYLAFKEHRENDLQGYLPFSRVVRISWLKGLLFAIPMAIFTFILYKYVAPNVLDQMVDLMRTQMEAQPNSDPEMVDKIVDMQAKWMFNPISMALVVLISMPIGGLLRGMLVGAFMWKDIPKFK